MSAALIGVTVVAGLFLVVTVFLLVAGLAGMLAGPVASRCPSCRHDRILVDWRHERCWLCRHAHAAHALHLGSVQFRHGSG